MKQMLFLLCFSVFFCPNAKAWDGPKLIAAGLLIDKFRADNPKGNCELTFLQEIPVKKAFEAATTSSAERKFVNDFLNWNCYEWIGESCDPELTFFNTIQAAGCLVILSNMEDVDKRYKQTKRKR
jgi:hypothetical protein